MKIIKSFKRFRNTWAISEKASRILLSIMTSVTLVTVSGIAYIQHTDSSGFAEMRMKNANFLKEIDTSNDDMEDNNQTLVGKKIMDFFMPSETGFESFRERQHQKQVKLKEEIHKRYEELKSEEKK